MNRNFSQFHEYVFREATVRRCSSKYVLLKISCTKQPLGGALKKRGSFLQAD